MLSKWRGLGPKEIVIHTAKGNEKEQVVQRCLAKRGRSIKAGPQLSLITLLAGSLIAARAWLGLQQRILFVSSQQHARRRQNNGTWYADKSIVCVCVCAHTLGMLLYSHTHALNTLAQHTCMSHTHTHTCTHTTHTTYTIPSTHAYIYVQRYVQFLYCGEVQFPGKHKEMRHY